MANKIEKNKLHVKISSPFETYFEGEALAVSGINKSGPFDVLPHHANFLAILTEGDIEIRTGSKKVSVPVQRGIMRVSDNRVQVFIGV